ncbi:MAG TPA: hypothetical protein VD963_03040 [Phycisphaerales bacterium]|nr:hypothetical protein [Phycisphaerales bacterium]
MVHRLGRWYARRIVNVNVNIILAGALAMVLTVIPVHMTRWVGIDSRPAILAVGFLADLIFDVATYYLLHWLANHRPWRNRFGHRPVQRLRCHTCRADLGGLVADDRGFVSCPGCGEACNLTLIGAMTPKLAFFRDATLVQFERMMLSPLLYAVVFTVAYLLLRRWGEDHREAAIMLGYAAGITTTRVVHTLWMIWRGRVD